MRTMFDNIGGKIKALAKIVTAIGIIASIITGVGLISTGEEVGNLIG